MDLNIRQVEAFKATMEAGSVTAAARRLNVSQPSVTKHLRRLEEHLGVGGGGGGGGPPPPPPAAARAPP
ncbi:MAG: LysR family transcriptional regulator, partial [Rhodospirillaceae bacterium]|nr:LysR family transcriptional regulator [Rhodospirillaceae bacterium]